MRFNLNWHVIGGGIATILGIASQAGAVGVLPPTWAPWVALAGTIYSVVAAHTNAPAGLQQGDTISAVTAHTNASTVLPSKDLPSQPAIMLDVGTSGASTTPALTGPALQLVSPKNFNQMQFLSNNGLPSTSDLTPDTTGTVIARTNFGRQILVPMNARGKPVLDANGATIAWDKSGRLVFASSLIPPQPEYFIQGVVGVYEQR